MNDETKKQCSNCKCWRIPDDYIGKKGNTVKQCLKCREKDARQKQRPEVKDKRNERAKEKIYSQTSRAKRREENEEEYLGNEAEKMRMWRMNNKEHLSLYSTTNINRRLGAIRDQAKKKGYVWELCEEDAKSMMVSECMYCGYLDLDTTVNGIDRMNNTTGYTPDNCVGCCGVCNFMKLSLDAQTFIERCQQISKNHGGPGENTIHWMDSILVRYTDYKYRADKKELSFEISNADFDYICHKDCIYCGRSTTDCHINGIDRKDNERGYVINNCVPCCKECNHAKRDLSYDVFINKCIAIASREHNFPDMPRCLNAITKRIQKT